MLWFQYSDEEKAMQKIIFKNKDNSVGIITPTQEAINAYGIEAIAKKDVPSGLEYKIVDEADVPSDRTFRDAWEWDTTTVPDGVGHVGSTFEGVLQ